ncbi:MAG: sortase-like acyltransferase [Flavipsychrobacter sp.]|nr:sortase-like acyltransferase [Flavipsychrobacter sp.]
MIRLAKQEDQEQIISIYNQAIDAGFQTAFTERVTVGDRLSWFAEHSVAAYPLFVYEVGNEVAGWLSVSPYRSGRAALRFCAEVSYFVHRDHQKQGIGTQLLVHALDACKKLNYRTVLAIILDRNAPSIKLMQHAGFEQWGHLPGVADFDGVVCGHVYYGKTL